MKKTQCIFLAGAVAGLVWWAGAALWTSGPPTLGPIMAEVDGVHPVRAVTALQTAYQPGEGYRDKYPPLGSVLFGWVGRMADPGFVEMSINVEDLPPNERRVALWDLSKGLEQWLRAERLLSRLAMAAAVALIAGLGCAWSLASGHRASSACASGLLGAACFGVGNAALYYGATTNVDSLSLLTGLGCVALAASGRTGLGAGVLGLAISIKDPNFVLLPVVLGLSFSWGGWGRLRRDLLAVSFVYALAAGALTGPEVWWEHLGYLVTGGVVEVDRIDHAQPLEWGRLLLFTARLLVEGLGLACLLLALLACRAAWSEKINEGRAWALAVSGTLASTLILFIFPVGFVYPRFLLLPLALCAVAGAVGLSSLLERRNHFAIGHCVLALLLGFFLSTRGFPVFMGAVDIAAGLHNGVDPRQEMVAHVEEAVPFGGALILFADEREHGPPLDPRRWNISVRGLNELETSFSRWRDARQARPDAVVIMTFPNDSPSGGGALTGPPVSVGETVAGVFQVAKVVGQPRGDVAERRFALRPTLTLLLAEGGGSSR